MTTDSNMPAQVVTLSTDTLLTKVKSIIEEGKAAKYDKEVEWRKWRRYYEGEQWKKNRPDYRVSNVINVTFANIETVFPLLCQSLPRLNAKPRTEADYRTAEKVTATFQFLHSKLDMRQTIRRVTKDMLMYGPGFYKVIWDVDKEPRGMLDPETGKPVMDKEGNPAVYNIGEVGVLRISPFYIIPDPAATCMEDAAYIIEAKPVDMDYIRLRWPDKAAQVKPGDVSVPILSNLWNNEPIIVDTTHDRRYTGDQGGNIDRRQRVMLYEVWVKELGFLMDPSTKPDYRALYRSYPGGRVITVAGDVVLQDRPNPYDDGRYPYIMQGDYEMNDVFWPEGEAKWIEPQQMELNKRSSQVIENAQLTANPKVLNPNQSMVDMTTLTSKPGEIITYNPSYEPKYMTPPTLPGYIFEMLESTKRDVEWVSGIHDVTMGRRPTGVTAASAIAELQEAAQTRVRDKMDELNAALCKVGWLMLSRIKQFYTEPRQIRIAGDDGLKFETLWNEELKGLFDIEIEIGSALPISQNMMFQQAVTLTELGKIDDEALLTAAQWPNRDKIIARMRQREEEEKAFQMQLAQAQQGPAPPGPPTSGVGEKALPPPTQFSLRQPPPPPPGADPAQVEQISAMLENASKMGGEMPPEIAQMLEGGQ